MPSLEIIEQRVDLHLPTTGCGVVALQSFPQLAQTEPVRWHQDATAKQLDRLRRTLDISILADHGAGLTHFTIFPEFAIPGDEGITAIEDRINETTWNVGTVVIGGVEGLSKKRYSELCSMERTVVGQNSSAQRVGETEWVNCCVVWNKRYDSTVVRWIQPKLVPSWPERNINFRDMFRGNTVFLFSGEFENHVRCNFVVLICYDWIGGESTPKGIKRILSEIEHLGERDLHFVFVVQHNDKPNHHLFLQNAREFFHERQQFMRVGRDNCVIIFANSAGGPTPGCPDRFGFTSLVTSAHPAFDEDACPPTFATKCRRLRGGVDTLGMCKEALLRENGACIHSFNLRHPRCVDLGPTGRCHPIVTAIVHPIDLETQDPRAPGTCVPATVKWINDQLDSIPRPLELQPSHVLSSRIQKCHNAIVSKVRHLGDDSIRNQMMLASPRLAGHQDASKWVGRSEMPIIDLWDESEETVFKTVVQALCLMAVAFDVDIRDGPVHGVVAIEGAVCDIVVVWGPNHRECADHLNRFYPGAEGRLRVLIAEDQEHLASSRFLRDIVNGGGEGSGCTGDILEPTSSVKACAFSQLLQLAEGSTSGSNFKETLRTEIGIDRIV